MKIVTIVGARPQFIKAAAVSRAIRALNDRSGLRGQRGSRNRIQEVLVHTGQHYDYSMDQVFFEELELSRPDYHLGVGSGSHAQQTAMMLERIETILEREKPEGVLVYGDTNSTLAGALAAVKMNTPVAHVEAGLRSYNRSMPEEINRILADHLSAFLFCPTVLAVRNLSREGIRDKKETVVKNVGDVMYDSILYYADVAERKSTILRDLKLFATDDSRHTPYYLATLHRAGNTDHPKRLKAILQALDEIGRESPVILPLHPRTRKMMKTYQFRVQEKRIRLMEPVSYLNMIQLMRHARVILTDSGGVQREAYWLRTPCVILREETEWVETLHTGWNLLVGTDAKKIMEGMKRLEGSKPREKRRELFGDGKASEKIVQILLERQIHR